MSETSALRYWQSGKELREFVLGHGLVLAGVEQDQMPAITGKGTELFLLLSVLYEQQAPEEST